MMSYVRRPSFTNSAMSTGHRFSLTSCGKKTMTMNATLVVMVLELVKQKN